MSTGVNRAILVGHLGRAPEVRAFPDGGRICTLSLATNRAWRDRTSGERREQVEWHAVLLSGDGLIDVAERYLRKGSKVYIEGRLRTRKWQTREGEDRYVTEVVVAGFGGRMVLLDPAPAGPSAQDRAGTTSGSPPPDPQDAPDAHGSHPPQSSQDPGSSQDFDDEIPF